MHPLSCGWGIRTRDVGYGASVDNRTAPSFFALPQTDTRPFFSPCLYSSLYHSLPAVIITATLLGAAQTPLTQYFIQQGARMYAFASSASRARFPS